MTLSEDTWPPYDMRHTTYESPATSKGKMHLCAHHRRSRGWVQWMHDAEEIAVFNL